MLSLRKHLLTVAAGLALVGGSVSVANAAGITFGVNETVAAGAGCTACAGNTFSADQLSVNDTSQVTLNPGGSFTESGSIVTTAFNLNNAPQFNTHLNTSGGYMLVADFNGTGGFGPTDPSDPTKGLTGGFSSFTYTLFLAQLSQSTPLNSADQYTIGAGDVILGTGKLVSGDAHLFLDSQAKGDFHVLTTFDITTDGAKYFTDLPPVIDFDTSGNNDHTTCPTTDSTCSNLPVTVEVTGGGKAQFQVPEPTSLALLGAGLFGFGIYRRRRTAA